MKPFASMRDLISFGPMAELAVVFGPLAQSHGEPARLYFLSVSHRAAFVDEVLQSVLLVAYSLTRRLTRVDGRICTPVLSNEPTLRALG